MFVKFLSNEDVFIFCWFMFVMYIHGTIGVISLFIVLKHKTEEQIRRDYLTAGYSVPIEYRIRYKPSADSTPTGYWILHKVKASIMLGIFGVLSTAAMISSLVFNILYNKDAFFTFETLREMIIVVAIFGGIKIIEIIADVVEIKRLKKEKNLKKDTDKWIR